MAFARRAGAPVPPVHEGFRARLRQPHVIAFFVAAFLTQVSFGPFYTFFSIYLSEHGYSTGTQGVLWTVGVLAEIAVFFLSSRIFRRWDASRVLMFALLSASVRWLMTALFPDHTPLMVLAQLTHALNFGAFFAAAMQLLVRFFPGRLNGHGQGVFYGLSSGVGGVCGALMAGQLWRFGGETAFVASSATALLAAALGFDHRDGKHPVHGVDEHPGAAIGHVHRPAGSRDRAGLDDPGQKHDLAAPQPLLAREIDPQIDGDVIRGARCHRISSL